MAIAASISIASMARIVYVVAIGIIIDMLMACAIVGTAIASIWTRQRQSYHFARNTIAAACAWPCALL